MSKIYFGFALANGMFDGEQLIHRRPIGAEDVRMITKFQELIPCLNPSHKATIDAMRSRFGIDVAIPEEPPKVKLDVNDRVIVMGVQGLPRLTDRHEYTEKEIASATFEFVEYTVLDEAQFRAALTV